MTKIHEGAALLGKMAALPASPDEAELDLVPNPHKGETYLVRFTAPEFTSLCPVTGQPDFAHLTLDYVPDRKCLELKSVKLYIWSFRDQGAFHEAVTNRILDDFVSAIAPRYMRLTARFNVRGGVFTTVVAEHRKRGWRPQPAVPLDDLPAERSTGA